MSLSDPDITQPNFILPRCSVPGCVEVERGVGQDTCVIWGARRLCYARHFPDFASSALADECSRRGSGPTPREWELLLGTLAEAEKSLTATLKGKHDRP